MSQTSESNSARPAGGKHDTESTDQTRVKWTLVGPGLVAAATGVGAADLVATMIAGQCQMRVFGTGVLGTRYCRVPGSWYRAEGYVGPGR